MPLDLAALLVEAGAVPAEQMERALARQRERGGALDTALLELGLVSERELVRFLSRASGLPPAPEPAEPDPEAALVFPARVAERHRLAPLRLEGRELSLLAAHPVDLAAIDEISFMLALHLAPHVAPEWRVAELAARAYGRAAPDRLAAVAARVRGEAEGGEGWSGPRATASRWDLGRVDPEDPIATAVARAVEALDATSLLQDVIDADPVPESPPGWSREDAFAALEAARDRDEVLAAGLRFARDHFEAAAAFALPRGEAAGVDAVGWPEARARCRSVRVPAHEPALFRAVLSTRGPYLGPVAREPGNERLLSALGRAWPAVALVYPVLVRDRPVCLLYADNGEAPVSPARLGDLLLVAGGIGRALARVLLAAKRAREAQPPIVNDEAGWDVREIARVEAVPPSGPDGEEPFRVAPASAALPASDPGGGVPD